MIYAVLGHTAPMCCLSKHLKGPQVHMHAYTHTDKYVCISAYPCPLDISFFLKVYSFIYLFILEIERSSIHWFTSQVATVARVELIQTQEPGASSGSLMQVQGPKALGCP